MSSGAPCELLACYADAIGGAVDDVAWFEALACFTSNATWSLIIKHNRRRSIPDSAVERMVGTLPHLLERARRLLA